ncbi:hypothetical protein VWZ82_13055 [Phaeobacter sp. JH20_41]|uniref:hypothetical protein n=1 Tax=Phaeobacter sp. JH20_41 TaxID=3112498 RepID=UPI003A8A7338
MTRTPQKNANELPQVETLGPENTVLVEVGGDISRVPASALSASAVQGVGIRSNGNSLGTATAIDLIGGDVELTGNLATVTLPDGSGGAGDIKSFANGTDLRADATASYPVGTILSAETESTRYIVTDASESDPDLMTLGEVKAFEIGPEFSDIYKLRGAIQRGDLRDGQRVFCNGAGYTVDSTATGLDSALWGFGVDGLRREGGQLDNLFLMSAFKNQDVTAQYFHLSNDGVNLKRLNQFPVIRGAGDATTGGRDSQPFWARRRRMDPWLMPVTAGEGLDYDFSAYVLSALGSPVNIKCQLQGGNAFGGVRGTTLPGATRAADLLWGPRFHNIGDKVYLTISIRTQDDYTDGFGNQSPTFRPYIAECLDIDTLTFGPPVAMNVGTPTTAMLEPDLTQADDGTWYMCIKNSANRNIEIHSATDPIGGAWSSVTTLDLDGTLNSLEGSIWVRQVYKDAATGARTLKYRVHAANNRNGDNELRGVPVEFVSTGGPEGPYGAAQDVNNSHSMRNGDIVNVALEPDPRAMRSLLDAATSFAGEYPVGVDECIRLPDEPHDFTPQQDTLYYVNTAGYACTLTVEKMEARRYWLACLSSDAGTYIDVENSPLCVGSTRIGGGAFQITEFLWVDFLGKYVGVQSYAVGGGGSSDGVATSVSFNSSTNILTLTRSVGADLTVDLSALDGGSSGLISQTPADGAKFIASGAPGSENTDAGELNLYPSGTDGVGIGVSRLGVAMSAGPNLGYAEFRNNGLMTITVVDAGGNIVRDAGAASTVFDLGSATTVNPNNGSSQFVVLSAARTLDLVGFLEGDSMVLDVRNADTHTLTITVTTANRNLRWVGGSAPTSFSVRTLIGIRRRGSDIFVGALGF